MNRDPVFGPVAMFGLGGVFVEVLKDVCVAPLPVRRGGGGGDDPLDPRLAAAARRARAAARRIFRRWRGRSRALSCLRPPAGPRLASIDLNPLFVLPGWARAALRGRRGDRGRERLARCDHDEKLLNFPIPEVRQRLAAGFGAVRALRRPRPGPDGRARARIRPRPRLRALPSMAVVLGYPGFWLANPGTGVDAVRVVHGEQAINLHPPLPVEGEVIGRSRVTGIVDNGEGKGALLYSESVVLDAAPARSWRRRTDHLPARRWRLRRPRGPGEEAAPVPEGAPDVMLDLPTRPEQALLYRLNGDDNPLHSDPAVPRRRGFPRPILHGLAPSASSATPC